MKSSNVFMEELDSGAMLIDWQAAFEAGSHIVGGKAWNLSRLHRYGFNVPRGGVLPISMYSQFIIDNEVGQLISLARKKISLENINTEESEKILSGVREKILQGKFSDDQIDNIHTALKEKKLAKKTLAVRSSATSEDSEKASFAGMHASFLNVKGLEQIIHAIKRCYASVWSTRAIAYRRKMMIDDHMVIPAVIIMEFINADSSGVAFSCDPVSGREDVYLINANHGLGESVVNGCVEPDTYHINRHSFETEQKQCGKKQVLVTANEDRGIVEQDNALRKQWVLNDRHQRKTALMISRVFSALGASEAHQDIEWLLKDDTLYVVQARPVTTLPRYTSEILSDQPDIWSNSNFRDALPMVVPVAQRDGNVHLVNRTILASFEDFGLKKLDGLSIAKLYKGRLYFNTGLYQRLIYHSVGMLPDDFNLFSGGHQPNIEVPTNSPFSGLEGLRRIGRIIRYSVKMSRQLKKPEAVYAPVNHFVAQYANTKVSDLTDDEFHKLFIKTEDCLSRFMDKYMLLCSGVGPYGMAIKSIKKYFGEESSGIISALATGQGDLPSADQVYELLELAEMAREDKLVWNYFNANDFNNQNWRSLPEASPFKVAFAQYLEKHGFRGVYEADVSEPRWNEDPSYLLNNIANIISSASVDEHKKKQQDLHASALEKLKTNVGFFRRQWVLKLVKDAVKGGNIREEAKAYSVKLFGLIRLNYLEAGHRFHKRNLLEDVNDIFYCSRADVLSLMESEWDGQGLQNLVDDRKQEAKTLRANKTPDVLIDDVPIFRKASSTEGRGTFKGIGVSAGYTEAIARCVHNPREGLSLCQGEIMVAPSTDPSWTPLFLTVGGIVLETGGYTSHGSIVAREYGIPAVVNVPGALDVLSGDQRVRVNGNNGSVQII